MTSMQSAENTYSIKNPFKILMNIFLKYHVVLRNNIHTFDMSNDILLIGRRFVLGVIVEPQHWQENTV